MHCFIDTLKDYWSLQYQVLWIIFISLMLQHYIFYHIHTFIYIYIQIVFLFCLFLQITAGTWGLQWKSAFHSW